MAQGDMIENLGLEGVARFADEPSPEVSKEEPVSEPVVEKETPTVETPVETPEAPAEGAPVEATEEPWEFPLDKFNERYEKELGRKYEKAEDLFEEIARSRDVDKYKEEIRESISKESEGKYQKEIDELKQIASERDVINFLGEDGYKREVLKKKLGDNINMQVVDNILNGGVDKMDPLVKAGAKLMLKNPKLAITTAMELAKEKAGIEPGTLPADFTELERAKIDQLAIEADDKFKEIRNLEIPELKNWETQKEEVKKKQEEYVSSMKSSWDKPLESLFEEFKGIEAGEKFDELSDFSFEAKSEDKKLLRQAMDEYVLSRGIEANENGIQSVASEMRKLFRQVNMDKIRSAELKHLYNKLIDKNHKEVHNEQEVNKSKNTPTDAVNLADVQSRQLKEQLGI